MESKLTLNDLLTSFDSPFNRTSMESKLMLCDGYANLDAAFNRTSMESKPRSSGLILTNWGCF